MQMILASFTFESVRPQILSERTDSAWGHAAYSGHLWRPRDPTRRSALRNLIKNWLFRGTGLVFLSSRLMAGETLFEEHFKGKLGPGWSWVREHREAWRASERGLEVRIEPGNQWGPQNDAKNVLVRAAPETTNAEIAFTASVENHPTSQYEQVDL